ncbi:MAG: hypothetical protein JSS27_04295 [Planctomycetes bacterium]|nr:hypothetical protein [Planctomycetota bacterium]
MVEWLQSWTASPVGGWWGLLAAAAVLVLLLFIGPSSRKLSTNRRRLLIVLRLGAIAVALWTMARPARVHTTKVKHASTVVILADRSRSMQVDDMAGGLSRWTAERNALDGAAAEIASFDETVQVKAYSFDSELHPLTVDKGKIGLGEKPDGSQTAIGAALQEVLRQHASQRLTGVILMSDGAQRAVSPNDVAPQGSARRLGDLGCGLYVVPLGQDRGPGQRRDVAVQSLVVPSTVYVKNELPVTGTIRIDGYANQPVPCQLLFETALNTMSPVGATSLNRPSDGQSWPVDFDYVPERAGEFKLTLRVPQQPGELLTTNNELSTFVTVLSGGVNVLYIEGTARVEQKFIRRVLDTSPNIKTDYLRIDAQRPETRPADLIDKFQPGRYDVYILGDIDSMAFEPGELRRLGTAIERGAGLMMLGGFHSFGAGGWGRTPLADALPVVIDRLERQNFDEPLREDLHWNKPQTMQPTRIGRTQSLMMLAPTSQNDEAWRKLPPLEGANRFRGIKTGGIVLAESSEGNPLLVAKDFGAGRVLAFAGDSTWHWAMSESSAEHRRFWRQSILWLARKEEAEGRVLIRLDQRRFAPGSRVEFVVTALSNEGQEVPDASFVVDVRKPNEQTSRAQLRRQQDQTIGTFAETDQAGDYVLHVTAQRGTTVLGTAEARFLVYQNDLEMDNPAADTALLRSLAKLTPGRVVAPEQLPELLRDLRQTIDESQMEKQTKTTQYDKPWVILAFVAMFSAEWYLRKRWGLV